MREEPTEQRILDGGREAGPVHRRAAEGRWLGTVRTLEGLRIEEIGSDYILGVWLDELEVPYVRMHRIRKP